MIYLFRKPRRTLVFLVCLLLTILLLNRLVTFHVSVIPSTEPSTESQLDVRLRPITLPQIRLPPVSPHPKLEENATPFHMLLSTPREANCNNAILHAPMTAIQEQFQPVLPGSEVLAYSAYYVHDTVRVVALWLAGRNDIHTQVHCQLWYRHYEKVLLTVAASFHPIPNEAARKYIAGHIHCPMPLEHRKDEAPYALTLTTSQCSTSGAILEVQDNNVQLADSKFPGGMFVVCPAPLNLHYNHVDQLVEWLEVNRMLGASHFYFYNHTVGPAAARVLLEYESQGLVTLLQWPLPMKVHIWPLPPGYVEEVKYFAQVGQLADCVLRASPQFDYAVIADVDEILVPRKHANWREMMVALDPKLSSASFMFLNTFFKTEWPSDPNTSKNSTIFKLNITTLLKNRRETTIYTSNQRSKIIVNPRSVQSMGVHQVWQYVSYEPSGNRVLRPESGLVHHYRYWEGMGEETFVEDTNMYRFANAIIPRVLAAKKKLKLINTLDL